MNSPAHPESRELHFDVPSSSSVSALALDPPDARARFVFAHGAGAGMRHPFMEALARRLAAHGVATFRYAFPYMEHGSQRPDAQPLLLATVRAATAAAGGLNPHLPLFAGGKSMGGRMTTLAAAESPLERVRGLVLVGFPLHGAGQPPGTKRAEHLQEVAAPMLFLQGTRDALAKLDLMREVCAGLGARATLHVVEGADHSFHVPKRSGRSDDDALEELARTAAEWMRLLTG